MSKLVDMAGKRFGRLVGLRFVRMDKHRQAVWAFRCDCGAEVERPGGWVRKGDTLSCGCLRKDVLTTHGGTPVWLYRRWKSVIGRCHSPSASGYDRYGAVGIHVCPEWRNDYAAFREWAFASGAEQSLEIDRIDNDRGYSPDNCRWVSRKENANNLRVCLMVEYNGQRISASQLAENVGLPKYLISRRLRAGMTLEEAIAKPANGPNRSRGIPRPKRRAGQCL